MRPLVLLIPVLLPTGFNVKGAGAMLNLGLELITLIVVNSTAVIGTSQGHRAVEVRRDLWRSSGPTPGSSRVPYSRLPRTMSSHLLTISKKGDSWQPVPVLCHPHSEEVFPDA